VSATGVGSVFGSAGVPANMTVAISGTHNTETMGWRYGSAATRWVLVPGTLLALATIIISLVAVIRHKGPMPNNSFDPSEPLDLMAAAAAGDLNTALQSMRLKGAELDVVLEWTPDRGPALLRSDVWSPSSPHTSAFPA
jgi:hypothetical protein